LHTICIVFKSVSANANSSIHDNFEGDSIATNDTNVADVIHISDLHLTKYDLQTTSTDAEISIIFKSLNANANSSIHYNFQFDSKGTNVNDLHLTKQDLHTISTDSGISIVSNHSMQMQMQIL
jgi:hypothetical protein